MAAGPEAVWPIHPLYLLLRRLGPPWQLALWLLITLRGTLELIAVLSVHLQPITVVGGDWLNLLITDQKPWSQLLAVWQRWDALWYQQIAVHGYHAGDGTVAFFPLYPLLSRAVSLPLLGHVVLAELLVSSGAFLAGMWLLYLVARLDVGPIAARLTVLLAAFFPVGFFWLAPYTESLYLTLTLAAFWYARHSRPWIAGLAGLAAALTRAQGAILVLPLAFLYVRQRDEEGKRPGLGLLGSALPGLGFLAATLYWRHVIGETQTGLAAQAGWGYQVVMPWTVLSASWNDIVGNGDLIELANGLSLLAFTGLALWATFRLPLAYSLYVWPYLGLLFTRQMYLSPLMSVSRFMLVLFPCFIMLAIWLARRPWLAAGWLVVGGLIQATLLAFWVHFGFVA